MPGNGRRDDLRDIVILRHISLLRRTLHSLDDLLIVQPAPQDFLFALCLNCKVSLPLRIDLSLVINIIIDN
jgi:hypothetical protein